MNTENTSRVLVDIAYNPNDNNNPLVQNIRLENKVSPTAEMEYRIIQIGEFGNNKNWDWNKESENYKKFKEEEFNKKYPRIPYKVGITPITILAAAAGGGNKKTRNKRIKKISKKNKTTRKTK